MEWGVSNICKEQEIQNMEEIKEKGEVRTNIEYETDKNLKKNKRK